MPANYGMLLMKRDPEQYTAMHLTGSPVSGFLSNANYCAVMALVDGALAPKSRPTVSLALKSFLLKCRF